MRDDVRPQIVDNSAMNDVIKRVGPADKALFRNVADDVFDSPVIPAALAAYLSAPDHLMVVAVVQGRVVGQARAIVHLNPDDGPQLYIDNLGVAPAFRRGGLGVALVRQLQVWGHEKGCRGAWVATESDNEAAIALYGSLGARRQDIVYFEYQLD